jgi:outer membrane protein TolC
VAFAALLPTAALAQGLSYAETLELARNSAPALRAADAGIAGAAAARPAAGTLPDPRLVAGIENLPVTGADRFSTTRDPMTMQRLGLMQEVPNRARREARQQLADARIERERATLAQTVLAVRREAAIAWLGVYWAERRAKLLDALRHENRLLQQTLPARIAAGQAPPAELTLARQDALAIDDRGDELAAEVRRARAELRRWVGARADEPLVGAASLGAPDADTLRASVSRQAEVAAYGALRGVAAAEMAEADAERHGDWAWEVAYSRRPSYDDMISVQFSFELPWQRDRRQQPMVEAKRQEVARIDAERDDLLRRRTAEVEAMLADSAALQSQLARLQGPAVALADERSTLALAAYQAGRESLGAVLAARAQAVELRLRAAELEGRRDALRVRLSTLIAE